jgi:mannose-6-phosphate isomerase class I
VKKSSGLTYTVLTFSGELDLEDETGKKVTLHEGEAFFIRRQSRVLFSAKKFAVVFKCSSYAAGLGKSKELIP